MSSFIKAISLPHVEQNLATSSILEPHEAQNSYIPPIILLPFPYDMLLHFRYYLKRSLCKIQFRIVSYTGTASPNQFSEFWVVDEWVAVALPFLDNVVAVSFDFVYWILFMPF